MFEPFQKLRAMAADRQADRDFPAPYDVVLAVDVNEAAGEWKLEKATAWASSPVRSGRFRRTVRASEHEALFEFQNVADAVAFALRFR